MSIRARRAGRRIRYVIVDDFAGDRDELPYEFRPRSSSAPLTMRQLVRIIDEVVDPWRDGGVGLVRGVARELYESSGDADTCARFVRVPSVFYPQLGAWYERELAAWREPMLDDEDAGGGEPADEPDPPPGGGTCPPSGTTLAGRRRDEDVPGPSNPRRGVGGAARVMNPACHRSFDVVANRLRAALADPARAPDDPSTPRLYALLQHAGEADVPSHLAMARYLAHGGQHEAAMRLLDSVTPLSPVSRDAWLQKAAVARALGDGPLAASCDAQAAQMAGSNVPFGVPAPRGAAC